MIKDEVASEQREKRREITREKENQGEETKGPSNTPWKASAVEGAEEDRLSEEKKKEQPLKKVETREGIFKGEECFKREYQLVQMMQKGQVR